MSSEKRKDERHRKIGRNLVLLQKLELLLKDLIFKANLTLRSNSTDAEFPSLEKQVEKQKVLYQKKTLGCLEKQFSKSALQPLPEFPPIKDSNPKTAVISVRIAFGTVEQQNQLKDQLEMITNGRNKLVHELLISFDLSTETGFRDMDQFLEQQHKELISIVEYLDSIREHCKILAKTFSNGSQNSRILEDCSKVSCVTKLLVYLYLFKDNNSKPGQFEWISLAAAKKDLNNQFPEAIPECRRHFKVKSLKKILGKIGIFDVRSLPTDIDKKMVFYRIKPEYSLREDEGGELYLCSKHEVESGGYFEETVSLKMFLEI